MKWIERLLLILGLVSMGYWVYFTGETMVYQAYETRALDKILKTNSASPGEVTARGNGAQAVSFVNGTVMGRIEIPRLDVSAVMRAGSDARTLRLAVGHIPGTALPGHDGNVGLAGHRDTFFRRLKNIRSGDAIQISTPGGVYRYRVEGTEIVEPDDVHVLDPTPVPSLTLVTCYPFSYIGDAPQRFIVRARLVGDLSAAN